MYVTNKGGAVQVVTDDHGAALIQGQKARKSTDAEVAEWEKNHLPKKEKADAPGPDGAKEQAGN